MERRAARAVEKKTRLYANVRIQVLDSEGKATRLIRMTHKDKNCITFFFPPFGDFPIIFI